MDYHKLLQKQMRKHLTEAQLHDPSLQPFLAAVNKSYVSFERDNELLNHAFSMNEKEYQDLYRNLNHEYELKKLSIEKLKQSVIQVDHNNEVYFNKGEDELLVIVDYLNSQIIKRHETEENLFRTLKLLTTLLSNLNSGIIVEDEFRKILFSNQFFCDIFSVPVKPEQMVGNDCSQSAEQSKHLFENPEEFVSRIADILKNQVPVFADELKLTDGRILERDYIPIFIEGEYKGHLWEYTDITERKNYERRLISLTNIQNAILNGTDYSIIFTDTSGIIQSFNRGAERMLGYKASDVILHQTPGIFHDPFEVLQKAKELSNELGYEIKPGFDVFVTKSKSQLTETNEWTYITADGKRLSVLLSVSSIRDASNEIIGYLGIASDITERKQSQDALERSEERYRDIVEKSGDIIYKTDESGYFRYLNPVAERITGFTKHELLNKHFSEIIDEEKRKEAAFFYHNQIKNKILNTYYEIQIVTKQGEKKWLGQSVRLTELDYGKIELTAMVIDITERRSYELKLIETNKKLELLQTLINNTSDGIQVAKVSGELVYMNYEASRRLGIKSDEVHNYMVSDIEKLFSNLDHWREHVEDVKSKGVIIIEGEQFNKVTQRSFPVEVTVTFTQIDSVGYIIANSRDITERKLIEDTIKKQKEKYQNIIANMNLGLVEVDLEERIQYVNPGFEIISGYTTHELIGSKATDIFIPNSHKDLVRKKISTRLKGISDMYEVPVKDKKGELRWWMISGAPNYNEKGEMTGSIGIHLDITEKKQLELELELSKSKAEESSRAKEAFLANMSHEIRTPLSAIIGMIRELSKEKLSDKQSQYVYNTSVASQHLLSVLNNILDISKIEAGELQLDPHHFNMVAILNDVKSIMLSKANEKGIYLKINHPAESQAYFIGDSSRFRQIFLNIIGNAIKFTSEGGVTVDYEIKNFHEGFHSVHLSITDTGIGMDEQYLKNVFSKFSQEDSSTSRKYGGSGLGMAITRELVQLMNGAINISSKKNSGTTISMKFLLPEGDASNVHLVTTIDEPLLKHKQILLVEDNEFNRTVACHTLAYHQCDITEAFDGEEALVKLQSGKKFDIILMDLQMPVMDGFEATKIIRNELKLSIPIIALTANAFKSELEQCLRIGMNDYVIKPFEEHTLISAIVKCLNLSDNTAYAPPPIENPGDQSLLFNLDKITGLGRNDASYVHKMVSIFMDQAIISIRQMKDAYKVKDFDMLYKVAHRIKPSIDGMGIESLKNEIREIELQAKDAKDSEQFKEQLLFLFSILEKVVQQLKQLAL